MAGRPSRMAAGPGASRMADLISWTWALRTAGMASQPGREVTWPGWKCLPHHEPMIRSGARAITSDASARMRSRALGCTDSSPKQSSPPAMPISSDTQRMPVINGSFHSSK